MVLQIAERIRADVTTAMKAGERDRVAALRLILSELQKAEKEASEAELIEGYLPQELDDAELEALVKAGVEATGASSPRDMGRVIKHVMEAAGGRADGKRVSTKVKEALN